MEPLWLVNGKRTGVDPADRGLAYGDGLFETMGVLDGRLRFLDLHLERLEEGCRRLHLPHPDRRLIEGEISDHCPRAGRFVVKLIVTRGPGARGYAPPAAPLPTRIVSIADWPEYPESHYVRGIHVRVCRARLSTNPTLAGIKHLNRLENVLAALELHGTDADQGLLLDATDRVVGGTSSNVFAVRDGKLLTPSIDRAGIKGVMRRVVLNAATELGIESHQRTLALADLSTADELFVTNALIGIWPVAAFEDTKMEPGPITRRLMRHLGLPPHA